MPQHQQTIAVPQYNASQLIALSHATFQHLGWGAELAFEDRLVGFTKKTWNRHHDHLLVPADRADDAVAEFRDFLDDVDPAAFALATDEDEGSDPSD